MYECAFSDANIKGNLSICRNTFYFIGKRDKPEAGEADVELSVLYRDVNSLEIVNSKKLLAMDSIQVGTKDQSVMLANSVSIYLVSKQKGGFSHTVQFMQRSNE